MRAGGFPWGPSQVVAALTGLAATAVLVVPPAWLPPGTAPTAALMVVTIGLWASGDLLGAHGF